MRKLFYPQEIQFLLNKKWFPIEVDKFIRKVEDEGENLGYKIRELEIKNYMYNQLLRDTDTMGMGNSVEIRVPFLDHRFVEFILSLYSKKLVHKKLLKKTMQGILPKEILERGKKPFTFPFAKWLHFYSDQLIFPILDSNFLFNSDAVKLEYINFNHYKTNWRRIWGIIVLHHWIKMMKLNF
jgi:asparagine synthase (glutamine-hydrolysing)